MTLEGGIELNRLDRSRSSAGTSSFTVHGPSHAASVSDFGRPAAPASGRVGRFIDSFRREDGTSANFALHAAHEHVNDDDGHGRFGRTAGGIAPVREHHGQRYYDLQAANAKTASTLLARELKGRHLQMIAIGGSIGTGLFVASGKALSQGGPGSVLLAYTIIGVMLWCTMQALGEMAVVFPVAGSFSAFSTRFIDPSWGFAMGWK
jgi:amino acid transporter